MNNLHNFHKYANGQNIYVAFKKGIIKYIGALLKKETHNTTKCMISLQNYLLKKRVSSIGVLLEKTVVLNHKIKFK